MRSGPSTPSRSRAPARRRPRLRRLRAVVAAVLLSCGVVLLAEAAVTVLWQEPLTALAARDRQAALERELRRMEDGAALLRAVSRPLRPAPKPRTRTRPARAQRERERMRVLARALARRARVGGPIGRIAIPKLGVRFVVVRGTDDTALERGPGHYRWTPLPGQRGTVGIAGHRTTYLAPFRNIHRLRAGDRIVLRMPYGRFEYRVRRLAIVSPEETSVLRRVGHDRLVLTSCHPLYSEAERIVAFAPLVRAVPLGEARLPRRARRAERVAVPRAFPFLDWQATPRLYAPAQG
ncbi:MAG: class E sortase [Thermoleophilia bacterium]|nr:class E sortase [Thermoleophilia bacterium]